MQGRQKENVTTLFGNEMADVNLNIGTEKKLFPSDTVAWGSLGAVHTYAVEHDTTHKIEIEEMEFG